jgi:hypothetical protein
VTLRWKSSNRSKWRLPRAEGVGFCHLVGISRYLKVKDGLIDGGMILAFCSNLTVDGQWDKENSLGEILFLAFDR